MGHGLVNLVYFVDTYFFCFYDIFPEFLVEIYLGLHCFVLGAVFYHDWFGTFFVVAWIYGLRNFCVLKFELFHVWLDFTYV